VISVSDVWRWAAVSNERAVANAREAATECSRRRVERAEVEQYLAACGGIGAATEAAAGVAQSGS
jgi:hypothetical protein